MVGETEVSTLEVLETKLPPPLSALYQIPTSTTQRITTRVRRLWEGNVFNHVCLFIDNCKHNARNARSSCTVRIRVNTFDIFIAETMYNSSLRNYCYCSTRTSLGLRLELRLPNSHIVLCKGLNTRL